MRKYWIRVGNEEVGPLTREQVELRVARGQITSDTLIKETDGLRVSAWFRVGDISELRELVEAYAQSVDSTTASVSSQQQVPETAPLGGASSPAFPGLPDRGVDSSSKNPKRMGCPACASMNVARARAIVMGETSSSEGRSVGIGVSSVGVGVGGAGHRSIAATELAKSLMPPPAPVSSRRGTVIMLVVGAGLTLITGVVLLGNTSGVSDSGCCIGMLVAGPLLLLLGGFTFLGRPERDQAVAAQAHDAQMQKWNRTWVCRDCLHKWLN